MKRRPREIEVHIEELVLHGFPHGARWDVADAIQRELGALLIEQGIPGAWQSNPEQIDAKIPGTITQTSPAGTGGQVARAVCGGPVR